MHLRSVRPLPFHLLPFPWAIALETGNREGVFAASQLEVNHKSSKLFGKVKFGEQNEDHTKVTIHPITPHLQVVRSIHLICRRSFQQVT